MQIHSDKNGAHIRLTLDEKTYLRRLAKGLEPRTGPRREALMRLVAEAAETVIGWFDGSMNAEDWFSLPVLEPERAAMLLCQFNPDDGTLEEAQSTTNNATGPRDLVRLLRRFEGLAKSEPQPRSLLQWLDAAQGLRLRYHPWIDQYLAARALVGSAIEQPHPMAGAVQRETDAARLASAVAEQLDEASIVLSLAKNTIDGLPDDPAQKRRKLLEWFRDAGGKRPQEGARGGKRGALTRVVEKSGIDKDTLGSMLDKAIDEKRRSDSLKQLTAKR